MTHPEATWNLEDVLEQSVQFNRTRGRWPNGVTRSGERIPFAEFLLECRQTGAHRSATAYTVGVLALRPDQHSVADVATFIEARIRELDVTSYKLDREALQDVLEILLRSMAVGGSVGPSVIIAGRTFPMTDFFAAYEDSPVQIRTDLAQLLDANPPVTVGRAIATLRRYHREAV